MSAIGNKEEEEVKVETDTTRKVTWGSSVLGDAASPTPAEQASSVFRYRTLRKSHSHVQLPRLIPRNLPFHQSKNNIAVQNQASHTHIWPLLLRDWFHVCLRLPTFVSISSLLLIWTALILIFALIYMEIDARNKDVDCGLGPPGEPISFAGAFAFSLETCTTVGYGLPYGSTQMFFEDNCPGIQIAIFFQMTWSMMFNAFVFAFSYSVFSKVEARGTQVVFGNKLVIQQVKEKVMMAIRCYDVDSAYPIVEARVRLYVMDRQAQLHVLRLNQPNDETGGALYLSLPTQITHHIDYHSALSPRGMPLVEPSHGIILRSVDALTNNREEIVCPVCGESYGTYTRLFNHVKMNRLTEERYPNFPLENSHLGLQLPTDNDLTPISLQEVKTYMEYNMSEIIVVLEGIDPQLSGTFQSLQSYKYEDIAWEGEFKPCMRVKNGKFVVNLAQFHEVEMPLSPPSSANNSEHGGNDSAELPNNNTNNPSGAKMADSIWLAKVSHE